MEEETPMYSFHISEINDKFYINGTHDDFISALHILKANLLQGVELKFYDNVNKLSVNAIVDVILKNLVNDNPISIPTMQYIGDKYPVKILDVLYSICFPEWELETHVNEMSLIYTEQKKFTQKNVPVIVTESELHAAHYLTEYDITWTENKYTDEFLIDKTTPEHIIHEIINYINDNLHCKETITISTAYTSKYDNIVYESYAEDMIINIKEDPDLTSLKMAIKYTPLFILDAFYHNLREKYPELVRKAYKYYMFDGDDHIPAKYYYVFTIS